MKMFPVRAIILTVYENRLESWAAGGDSPGPPSTIFVTCANYFIFSLSILIYKMSIATVKFGEKHINEYLK